MSSGSHGRARRGYRCRVPGGRCLPAGGTGHDRLAGPRRDWDRSLSAGKERENPAASSRRASSRWSPFASASAEPAAAPGATLTPVFWRLGGSVGEGKPLCYGGKRCSPCRRETSCGETRVIACHNVKMKSIQEAGGSSGNRGRMDLGARPVLAIPRSELRAPTRRAGRAGGSVPRGGSGRPQSAAGTAQAPGPP